jgi:hypothetical protein
MAENHESQMTCLLRSVEPRIQEYLWQQFYKDYGYALSSLMEFCESPIELLLMLALVRIQRMVDYMVSAHEHRFLVYPQYPLKLEGKRMRIDIYLEFAIGDQCHKVAVECDGHEFHERTKEQAQADKARDRLLQRHGIRALRFTGSEIWEDPDKCAFEILRVCGGFRHGS